MLTLYQVTCFFATLQGLPKADAAALGGPTLAGKSAEAVHPSLLQDAQNYGGAGSVISPR